MMKQKFLLKTLLLLCALVAGSGSAWGDSETITFSNLGLENSVQYTEPFGTNISVTFAGGANDGKYYTTGSGIRTYANGTITITANGNTITTISTTFSGANYAPASDDVWSTGTGTSGVNASWSGSATEVVMTRPSGSGHWRLQAITVTYTTGGSSTVATPSFSPAAGTYTSTQNVTISTTTPGATIYYTTDGNDPTTNSSVYSSAISVSTTTTIKAMAVATGYDNSSVAEATYTIVSLAHAGTAADPYTVADAHTAIDANTGLTDVYVKGIVCIGGSNLSSGAMNYWISDDGTETNKFEAYRGKGKSGADFSSTDDIQVGDIVVVTGNLTKYNSTYEFAQDNQLAKIVRKPSFSPAAGAVNSGETVTLSSVVGATIYYTTDGSEPTTNSATYSAPISITAATTIKAFAVNDGLTSEIVEAAYTVSTPTATPTISLATGTYTSAQSVTITCETAGAAIYYTTDGNDPTTSSTEYTAAITIDASCTLKAIAVASGYAPSAVASATYTMQIPTLAVSPTTATKFTYNEGEGPSATQTFTLSGENLTAAISVSVPAEGSFEISSDGTSFSNSLSLGAGDTFVVRMKAGLSAGDYNGTVTISSTGAENVTINLTGTVAGANVTWDLTTNSYSSASTNDVSWTSSQATMTLGKGTSATNANNYLGGSGSYTHTRFYQNQVLTIAPASGYQILSAEITAVSGYATGFTGNNWTNATTSTSGTTVTVTPTDGTQAMSVTISGACRATAITVYYATNATPSIAVNTTLNVTCAETDGTIDVTYNNIADNSSAEVILCDNEGNTTTYDWIDVELDGNKDVYYVIAANTGDERTGYLKVKVGNVTSDIVTITQAEYVELYEYTLASSITSGKHYVIASEDGMVMAEQKTNNRNAVQATLSSNTLSFASNAGVHEVIIYGPDKDNLYTIYDETGNGYLYAASSNNNHLKTQATVDDNSRWAIDFSESVASIVATQSNNRNVMQFNTNLFSCYASDSQSDVYLYEKSGEATPTEAITITSAKYATYCSSNALDFNGSGVKAYMAKSEGSKVKLTEIEDGIVPAGAGVVLYCETAYTYNVPSASTTSADDFDYSEANNEIIGVTSRTQINYEGEGSKKNYILANKNNIVGFYKATGAYLQANRAYLSTATLSGAREFLGFDDDETTGINNVNVNLNDNNVYDLQGRKVNGQSSMVRSASPLGSSKNGQLKKGLYIVNGKKTLAK